MHRLENPAPSTFRHFQATKNLAETTPAPAVPEGAQSTFQYHQPSWYSSAYLGIY